MKIPRLIALLLSAALLCATLTACTPDNTPSDPSPQAKSYYEFFDTVTVIFSYRNDAPEVFEENCLAVSSLLGEYHRLFDIYYEYAGLNNLKTVNQNAGKSPVKVDARLIEFLLYAKEIYALTGGKTNVALGSVLSLWHDARESGIDDPTSAALPDAEALQKASKHTDIEQLIINVEESTVFLADPDMRLDVGAIAKGYATEKAAQLLFSRGVTAYALNVGGNLRTLGEKPSGNGWITGITNPNKNGNEEFVMKVILKDTSLVTSGDYERFYTVDGVSYHHIIDPNTNMPAAYFSSVSIFTKDSGLADALSTALFCMPYAEGLALIESIGDVEALWVERNGTVHKTDGIEPYVA